MDPLRPDAAMLSAPMLVWKRSGNRADKGGAREAVESSLRRLRTLVQSMREGTVVFSNANPFRYAVQTLLAKHPDNDERSDRIEEILDLMNTVPDEQMPDRHKVYSLIISEWRIRVRLEEKMLERTERMLVHCDALYAPARNAREAEEAADGGGGEPVPPLSLIRELARDRRYDDRLNYDFCTGRSSSSKRERRHTYHDLYMAVISHCKVHNHPVVHGEAIRLSMVVMERFIVGSKYYEPVDNAKLYLNLMQCLGNCVRNRSERINVLKRVRATARTCPYTDMEILDNYLKKYYPEF
mmetsp:Transcript_14679/g.32410  ORF Transcript_14679/g.32410 Transcript_14679/m.32410 type:complete len:297 (-) Transcript_14679:21-911(-)